MKQFLFITFCLSIAALSSQANARSLRTTKILDADIEIVSDSDDYDTPEYVDEELQNLSDQNNKLSGLLKGFKKKSNILKKLKVKAEKLVEVHQDYSTEKNDYEVALSSFNHQLRCVENPNSRDCRPKKRVQQEDNYRKNNLFQNNYETQNRYQQQPDPQADFNRNTKDQFYYPSNRQHTKPNHNNNFNNYNIMSALKRSAHYFRKCYQTQLNKSIETEPVGSGKVTIRLEITQHGDYGIVNHIHFSPQSFYNKRVLRCISSRLRDINFPKPPTSSYRTKPITLNFRLI